MCLKWHEGVGRNMKEPELFQKEVTEAFTTLKSSLTGFQKLAKHNKCSLSDPLFERIKVNGQYMLQARRRESGKFAQYNTFVAMRTQGELFSESRSND